jgi:pimeloyl-ACP methyl ester carboxylesterase
VAEVTHVLETSGRPPIYCDIKSPEPKGELDKRSFPVIVFSHGFLGCKDWGFLPQMANAAIDAGFSAVKFSFSHCGITPPSSSVNRPDLFKQNLIKYELEDFSVVFDALGSGEMPLSEFMDLGRISLVGFSRGGATALLHSANTIYENRSARVKVLCTIGAMSDWFFFDTIKSRLRNGDNEVELDFISNHLKLVLSKEALDDYELHSTNYDLLRAAGKLNIPWLIIHGEKDETVPPDHARRLYSHGDQHQCHLELIKDADHFLNFSTQNPQNDQVMDVTELILSFVKAHIA